MRDDNPEPAVSLRGVRLPGFDGGVSFDLAAGECVALLDRDEQRRTALLRVIAGLERPVHGTIQAPTVAAVWHDDGLPEDVAVGATIRQALADRGIDLDPAAVLAGIGLQHRVDHEPWAMSAGERRRIALAVCFACDADMIVLDEPERGLDVAARRWVTELVREARSRGCVVLIATHDATLAEACGDFVVDDLATLAG